jgi:hypothetical protein
VETRGNTSALPPSNLVFSHDKYGQETCFLPVAKLPQKFADKCFSDGNSQIEINKAIILTEHQHSDASRHSNAQELKVLLWIIHFD